VLLLPGVLAAALLAASPCASQPCAGHPRFKLPVTIDNTASPTGFSDLEVAVTVDTATPIGLGHMLEDAADVRFTDGTSCLCHTLESGLGTTTTVFWVRVPALPAGGTTTIFMRYGDPAAASADDPVCTFAFYEGFEDADVRFTSPCGDLTVEVGSGLATLTWDDVGMLVSGQAFPEEKVFTGEALVLDASGNWPGFFWALDDANHRSYALLMDKTRVTLSVSGSASGECQGHNFATPFRDLLSPVGIWRLTWVATGDIRAEFPTLGPITTTDATHARNADLRLMLGGIYVGDGSMTVDWVRARQAAFPPPTVTVQPAQRVQPLRRVIGRQ